MERISFGCQVCLITFDRVYDFKSHVYSSLHRKKFADVFQPGYKGCGRIPSIELLNQRDKLDVKQPIIGLSLCFSRETKGCFYLCHLCEEKCRSDKILSHLASLDHCRNYFCHTNPNALRFSWIPSINMMDILRPDVTKKEKGKGTKKLKMLELPGSVLNKLYMSTYCEVMHALSENDKLLKLLEADIPKRMMIQTYQMDANREHPLLGMQHLVECICVGRPEKRHYLCTLCNLTLATHAVIKHVLSFDHIFCYFRAWHPSTLLSKEYYNCYTESFASSMLDFVKQTEEIHGTAEADMKQMSLKPAKFTSVNFTCYVEALKELESIRKENEEGSLITSVKPGNKLENSAEFKLRCQNCSKSFVNIFKYCAHLSQWEHTQVVAKVFGKGAHGCDQTVCKPILGLYKYLKESWRKNNPLIGVPLVVTCVSTRVPQQPLYVCFACQDCFPESLLRQHFDSRKHLIHTLLYQNPWRLPLVWEKSLDLTALKSSALEEEKERGPNHMMLKVLDMPHLMFQSLVKLSYPEVMEKLEHHHMILKRDVPPMETNRELNGDRFPLLGRQFLVMHTHLDVRGKLPTVGYLCLLCKKRLTEDELYAHEFSRGHVETFLDCFHPGSLDSNTDAETLSDFAKQAARCHCKSDVQVVKLDKPIREPCAYSTVSFIVTATNKRNGTATLDLPIIPKTKLVPRKQLKEEEKDPVGDNGKKNGNKIEGCEKPTGQKSTDDEMTVKQEVAVGVTDTHCGENGDKAGDKEMPTPRVNEPEERTRPFSETGSVETKNAGEIKQETCPVIKDEKIEEPTTRKPNEAAPDSCHNTNQNDGTSKISKDVLTLKGQISQQDLSLMSNQQEEPSAHEGNGGKRASSDGKQQQGDKLWKYLKRKSREPVVGLSALLECHCDERDPIYLCDCCSLKIPEEDIVSHVTGANHQKMYLAGLQKHPPTPGMHLGKTLRHVAALFEEENGYGNAQVVDLDDEMYNNISKQNFESAIRMVKALKNQQDIDHEHPPTSALSGVQPEDACFLTDDLQEMNMEIDDGDVGDSEGQPSIITTSGFVRNETTSSTTQPPLESSEDVKVNTGLPAPRSCEDKTAIISNTSGGPVKPETTSDSTVATPITSVTAISELTTKSHPKPISKPTAATSSCTAATNNLREAAYDCRATISICSATAPTFDATISKTTSVTKPLESRTAADVTVAPSKTVTTSSAESTVRHEAACRSSPASTISERASKTVVAPQTVMTSVATDKMPQMSDKRENAGAVVETPHMKNSVGSTPGVAPNIHKSKTPAAPHLTVANEPSHSSASRERPSENTLEVGVNQLIKVMCKEKRQVYCQLCKVRLHKSLHTNRFHHQLNYVKMIFPQWTCKPSELRHSLHDIVANLSEAERGVGPSSIQIVEVKIDVYKELAGLSADKALERLKAFVRHKRRPSQVSSPSTTNTAEALRWPLPDASPCEASSTDNGLSPDNQSEQEDNHELHKLLVQIPEIESSSKEEVGHSMESPEPEACDQLPLSLIWNINKPIANPMQIQEGGVAAAEMEEPQGQVPPLATDSTGWFAQTPDTCQKTPMLRQPQKRSHSELQDPRKVLGSFQKTSLFNTDLLSAAGTVNTAQQNQPRPCQTADRASKHSQALPRVLLGVSTDGCSHLSRYLKVKGLDCESVIGLGLVWECRFVSEGRGPLQNPFFLCQSCRQTLSLSDICHHMVSKDHQLNFIMTEHPDFLYFWPEDYRLPDTDKRLPQWMKLKLLKGIAKQLSKRERCFKMDAQGILMGPELYEYVRTAPFSKALEIVQNIKTQHKLTICAPQQKDQQPEDQRSRGGSHLTEKQPAQTLHMDQRSNDGVRQKSEKHNLGDLDGAKRRRVLRPLHVTSVSSKADPVVSPISGAPTCLSPQEQPEPRPPVSRHQRSISEVQSESLYSSTVGPKTTPTLSVAPRDQCLPTRKRPAVESIETLVRSCTDNPKLEDPLPAKRRYNELQPIVQPSPNSAPESACAKPAATCTLPSPKDKDVGPGSDEPDLVSVDWTNYTHIMALVREMKSALNASPPTSAPDSSEKRTFCAYYSPESGAERRWDQKSVQPTSTVATHTTRWDSKWKMDKSNPPYAHSLKETFSTAPPVVSHHENQLVAPNDNNSSLEGSTLTRGNLWCGATAVSNMLPSASIASGPQHQRRIDAQSNVGNTSQSYTSPTGFVVLNDNPGQIPQPQDNTETNSAGGCQTPINSIVTVRPNHPEQQFTASFNDQDYTEVNGANQVIHSVSTVVTDSPREASGAYGHYSQMAYVTSGQSGYFSSEAVRNYPTPIDPPVHTGSSYQCERYTTGGLRYPSQVYPEQEAARFRLQSFGPSIATPTLPGWVMLGMQQQQLLQQQQQMFQQQYSSCPSAPLPAGQCNVTNGAAYVAAVPFTTPASGSQKLVFLNDYSANGVPLTLNSSSMAQNIPQVYLNLPVSFYPPAANTEVMPQASANSFASG